MINKFYYKNGRSTNERVTLRLLNSNDLLNLECKFSSA